MMRRRLVLSAFVVGVMALTISAVADPCNPAQTICDDPEPVAGTSCAGILAPNCKWVDMGRHSHLRGYYCMGHNPNCTNYFPGDCNTRVRVVEVCRHFECINMSTGLPCSTPVRYVHEEWIFQTTGEDCRRNPCPSAVPPVEIIVP